MVIFHGYVSLPEGIYCVYLLEYTLTLRIRHIRLKPGFLVGSMPTSRSLISSRCLRAKVRTNHSSRNRAMRSLDRWAWG